MARGAGLALFVAAAAAGFGAGHLALTQSADRSADAAPDAGVSADAGPRADAGDPAARAWPAAFGTPPQPGPDAARPESPLSEAYALKGLVAGAEQRWAIVSDGETDALVRLGDSLPGGETVAGIDARGVWIEDGERRALIAFDDREGGVGGTAGPRPAAGSGAARVAHRAELQLSEFRGRDFRRMLGRAGGVRAVETRDGVMAQEILWVRNGQLYDRIGLRKGDKVLTINGYPAGDPAAIAGAARELLGARAFELEIIRAGAASRIEVEIADEG